MESDVPFEKMSQICSEGSARFVVTAEIPDRVISAAA
jgi:hypothetical protein